MSGEQALLSVEETRTRLTTVTLEESEYWSVINDSAREGIIGGTIYDALHAQTARGCNCKEIRTLNVSHFKHVAPDLIVLGL